MNIEKERERFEIWLASRSNCHPRTFEREKNEYVFSFANARFEAWIAAKQDEMTEERARDILQIEHDNGAGFCEITNLGLMLINNYQVAVSKSNSDSYTKDHFKALAWWMENKV